MKIKTNKFFNIFLLVILVISISIRFNLNDRPIQFNEGTYAYIADKMLNEDMDYLDIYDSKPPGIYYLFMFFMRIFGNESTSFHLVTVISDIFIILLIYLIALKLFSHKTALFSSSIYSILYTSYTVSMGGFLEPPMMAFTLICVYFYLSGIDSNKLYYFLFAGFFLGISFMIKQPAIIFFMTVLIHLSLKVYLNHSNIKYAMLSFFTFVIGFFLFTMPIIILIIKANKFEKYIFSVFYSSFGYGPGFIMKILRSLDYIFLTIPFFAILSLISIIVLFKFIRKKKIIFLYSWLIPIIIFLILASDFQPHYLIQIIPVSSIFVTLLFSKMIILKPRLWNISVILIICLFVVNISYIIFEQGMLRSIPIQEQEEYTIGLRMWEKRYIYRFFFKMFIPKDAKPGDYDIPVNLLSKHRLTLIFTNIHQQKRTAEYLKKNMDPSDKLITITPGYAYLANKTNNYKFLWINPMIARITDISDFAQYASDSKYFLFEYWQEEQGHIPKSFLDCIKENWELIESIDNWHTHVYKNTDSEVCRNIW